MKKLIVCCFMFSILASYAYSQSTVTANFGIIGNIGVCEPQTVFFKDSSTNQNPTDSILSWKWFFGDGDESSFQQPLHTYRKNGKFDVSLIIVTASGEKDSITKAEFIKILGPIAKFKIEGSSTGVAPLDIKVIDESQDVSNWKFILGDLTDRSFTTRPADSTFILTYNNEGTYYLYLEASDNVTDPITGFSVPCISIYGDTANQQQPHFKIEVLQNTSIFHRENSLKDYIKIYPNPNHGNFNIEIEFPDERNTSIVILNTLGEIVCKFDNQSIISYIYQLDLSESDQGTYFINILTNEENSIIPFSIIK